MYSLMPRLSSADSSEDDQLVLPLHHGGFSIQGMTAQEAVAAQLSAAALTQVAMRQGLSDFRPFDSSNRLLLLPSLCETLHDAATKLWSEEIRALSFTVICDFLPLAQREYTYHAAAGAFQSLLDLFYAPGAAGLKSQARLSSCDSRSASIFLDTLPMAAPLTIPDAAFTSGMRHRLCLSQMLLGAPVVACDCSKHPRPRQTTQSATLARRA
jgi:hypothetical protein